MNEKRSIDPSAARVVGDARTQNRTYNSPNDNEYAQSNLD